MGFKERLEYSEESPSGLIWKIPPKNKKVGDAVGYVRVSKRGVRRWQTMIDYKSYLCHRLIWELVNGEIPEGLTIDHIDQNPLNNKIENLRCVPNKVNVRNKGIYSNSSTGIAGVSTWICPRSGDKYYQAQWVDLKGNKRGKKFQVKRHGEELAEFLAQEYRQHQIDLLNLQGAGYTEKHGT
jgi:hypothetical protein